MDDATNGRRKAIRNTDRTLRTWRRAEPSVQTQLDWNTRPSPMLLTEPDVESPHLDAKNNG